jgi:23S rRNA pseudouridine1911/1915/1917 synthase
VVRELFRVSWGKARSWIEAGKVSVDGATVTEPTTRVAPGAGVSVDEGARRPRRAELEDDQVVYADAQVVVVAKPAGVSTVPYEGTEPGTLDARVRAWLSRRGLAPRGSRASLGVVHRIDKETSGLVVFTRTWLAKQKLAAQFRAHSVHRRYLAIAHGDVRTTTLRSLLVADRGDGLRGSAPEARRRAVSRAPAGTTDAREAVTHVERLESLAGATLIGCRLETGRTHQIRIQLSESGHPLLGERVYVRDHRGEVLDAPRLMLHAAELGFVHPVRGEPLRWEQPMPPDMRAVLERLRGR